MKKVYLLLILCLGLLYEGLSQGSGEQLAGIRFEARVGHVFSSGSGPCHEDSAEEYSAFVRLLTPRGDFLTTGCLTCNQQGDCIYGQGEILTNGSNAQPEYGSEFRTYIDAWEDDDDSFQDQRCVYNSGIDECRMNEQNSTATFNFKHYSFPGPPATTFCSECADSPVFGDPDRHTWTLRTSWRYNADSGFFPVPCTPSGLTARTGFIDAFRVYLDAGQTYEFETTAGPDTYLRLYGLDGYTIVASDDNGASNNLSKITYTPPQSGGTGTYFIEVSEKAIISNPFGGNPIVLPRIPLTLGAKITYRMIPPPKPTILASTKIVCSGNSITFNVSSSASSLFARKIQMRPSNSGSWNTYSNVPYDFGPGHVYYDEPSIVVRALLEVRDDVPAASTYNCQVYSDEIIVYNVEARPTITFGGSSSICPKESVLLNANGAYSDAGCSYQWEISDQGSSGPWTDIPGATNAYYNTGQLTTTCWYRVRPVCPGNGCPGSVSAAQKIEVKAPAIVCPSNITMTTDPLYRGACEIRIFYTHPQEQWDGCSTITQTGGLSSASYFPIGTTTNTFTATNAIGQTASCSFTVTIVDNEPIQLVCADPKTIEMDPGSCTIEDSNIEFLKLKAIANDNCEPPAVSGPYPAGPYGAGEHEITWTVENENGDVIKSCSHIIKVEDWEKPACNVQNIAVNSDPGQCGAIVNYEFNPTDNCGIQSTRLTQGRASGSFFPVGTEWVEFEVYDMRGNGILCAFSVWVRDVESPKFDSCPESFSVNIDSETGQCGSGTNVTYDLSASDNCTGSIEPTFRYGQASGSFFRLGTTDNSYYIYDPSTGRFDYCDFSITVLDCLKPPVATCRDVTVSADENCQGMVLDNEFDAGSSDPNGIGLTFSVSPSGPYALGTTNVILTVDNGIKRTCTATITVEDHTPPIISCAANQSQTADPGQCQAAVTVIGPSASDNCGAASLTNNFNGTSSASDVYPAGITTITWTAIDAAGNKNYCTQRITVLDVTPPSAVCQNVTVQLDASGNGSTTAEVINDASSDACGIASMVLSQTSFGCGDVGNNTVTLTVTDNNDNVSTCDATVKVEDKVAPTARCQNVTVQLNASGVGSATAEAINDASSDACGIVSMVLSQTSFGCGDIGDKEVTLTVTDDNNNVSTCTAIVKVEDNVAPVIACQNVSVQLAASGSGSTTAAAVNNASSDACGIASLALSKTSFGCGDVGNNPVTLTVTDNNGNASTCSATVKVEDKVAPTALCQNVTVQLDASGTGSTTATAVNNASSDACGIASLALSQTNFDCSDVGNNPVILTVTDKNGNFSTCAAIVKVEDNVAPMAYCQNVIVQLDASGAGSTTAAAVNNASADACGIASLALSQTSFDCSDVGNNTVTLTVTDKNDNFSTCTATVKVEDNVAPTALCQNVIVQLNASGTGSTTAAAVNNASSDACGIASLALSKTSFECGDVGNNPVTLTVTDRNGNASTCTATVKVEDQIAPVFITCPASFTVTLPSGECETTVTYPAPLATDNCRGTTTVQTAGLGSGSIYQMGPSVETYVATDASGNKTTCTFTVTVDGDQKDSDGDGISNGCDICPGANDLTDSDGDGLPDCLDPCPTGSNNTDTDGDGIGNGCDNCPLVANGAQADSDGDGVGNDCDRCQGSDDGVDADGDGVPNGCDKCPGGDDRIDANNNGVPDACDLCLGTDLTADAGGCKTVYKGYRPAECTTLTASGLGGEAPYHYLWSTGETTATISVCPATTTTYAFTVTDDKECEAMAAVTVQVVNVSCGNNKVAMCLNGQTLCVTTNKVQQNLDKGATLGSCGLQPCANSGLSLVALPTGSMVNSASGANKVDFTLYPNPARQQLNVRLKDFLGQAVQLTIYDQLGRAVQSIRIDEVQLVEQRIEVERLGYGTYLLQLRSDQHVLVKKFVILE